MIQYIAENWATLLVAAIVIVLLALAFAVTANKKKCGSDGGCGGNCSGCQSAGSCAERDKKN